LNVDGRAVANFVLDFCDRKKRVVTNLALQKIVYFCHVWYLVEYKRPLIKQRFEAWTHGPVLQYLYREFKDFESKPITKRSVSLNISNGSYEIARLNVSNDELELIESVVEFYSRIKPGTLVELSHTAGGPWHVVWNHDGEVNPGMKINDEDILSFYGARLPPFSRVRDNAKT